MLKFLVIGKAGYVSELCKAGIVVDKSMRLSEPVLVAGMKKWKRGRIPVYRLNP